MKRMRAVGTLTGAYFNIETNFHCRFHIAVTFAHRDHKTVEMTNIIVNRKEKSGTRKTHKKSDLVCETKTKTRARP